MNARMPTTMIRPILIALAVTAAIADAHAQTAVITPAPVTTAPAAGPAVAAPEASAAQAQLPISLPSLTLAEAEALLLERNLVLVAARRGVDAARAQVLVADTSPPPTIGYQQQVGGWSESARFRGYNGVRGTSPLSNGTATLTVTIERGGKRELRTRLAQENVSVAEAQVLDTLRGQIFQLRQAFIGGLEARANLGVALANRRALDNTEGLLRRQVQEGQIPESDLLRFQASRLPFEQDLANAAQAYAAAAAQVAAILGSNATATRTLSGAAARDPVAIVLAPVPFDLRGRIETVPPAPPAREQLAEAVAGRPDVVAALRNAAAAEANTRLAEAARSRDLTVTGSASRSELSQDLPGGSRSFAAGSVSLGVSIPLFTSRLVEGGVASATAQQGQARALAQAALAQAQADVAGAWASYVQARQLLTLTTAQALRRAEEAYQSTEAAYRAGGRTLLDVLDALRTLNATRVAANGARAQMLRALAGLEQASGVGGISPRL